MCWFSAEHEANIAEAKAGERLAIRSMNWHANWVIREQDLGAQKPCPVCLRDQTRVLFRLSETEQASLHLGPEVEAVFKMVQHPKLDVFELPDGRQINLRELPSGLILDVLVVPGREELSAILHNEPPAQQQEDEREDESFLARIMARL